MLEVVVGDEAGGDGPAEAEHRRSYDDCHRWLQPGDDGTHGQWEDELGQKDHARDDADVGADASDLTRLRGPGLVLQEFVLAVLNQKEIT